MPRSCFADMRVLFFFGCDRFCFVDFEFGTLHDYVHVNFQLGDTEINDEFILFDFDVLTPC